MIVSCNDKLIYYAVGTYVPYWLSLLMTSVTRVNPVKLAIASCSGLEDSTRQDQVSPYATHDDCESDSTGGTHDD